MMLYDFAGRPLEIASDGEKFTIACDVGTISILNPMLRSFTANTTAQMIDVTTIGSPVYREQMAGPLSFSVSLDITGSSMVYGEGDIFRPLVDQLTVLELLKITREKLQSR